MPQDLTDDKSTLVQVMAWCHQATSQYLNPCWPRSPMPYGITRPQWVTIIMILYSNVVNLFPDSRTLVSAMWRRRMFNPSSQNVSWRPWRMRSSTISTTSPTETKTFQVLPLTQLTGNYYYYFFVCSGLKTLAILIHLLQLSGMYGLSTRPRYLQCISTGDTTVLC